MRTSGVRVVSQRFLCVCIVFARGGREGAAQPRRGVDGRALSTSALSSGVVVRSCGMRPRVSGPGGARPHTGPRARERPVCPCERPARERVWRGPRWSIRGGRRVALSPHGHPRLATPRRGVGVPAPTLAPTHASKLDRVVLGGLCDCGLGVGAPGLCDKSKRFRKR